ncbi:Eco57I restriction-modification methylase domain-containing protein [Halomarina oriensis]|uniref:site-specific DNA-methyltransferase (adenine-specific) n=1 Tax=Halomarina oriensis TaxID=671145 RepID=A0A6B0GN03_9EURY|nr:N-6 DNA methylase [Halomarina oriensis]MWG36154.1 N-6 DNA methylase [Halomarina oriensis]
MSQATLPPTPYLNSSLFSGYYLDERVADLDAWDCDEEATAAFETLVELWNEESGLVGTYKEDELLDSWIDEVLSVLGFDTLSESTIPEGTGYTDRLLYDSAERRRDAVGKDQSENVDAKFGLASAVLEAKQWDTDFTKKFDEQRSYRDASHQIKYYLERTPERLRWGVLTDGRKWRLYGTKDYETQTYYEIDLPELLESGSVERFKYFYVFFRAAAFHETAETCFLDRVWNESETAAQELGEDLQDNVFTALRVLGEGFVEENDLDIGPEDEAARDELKEQSLVLLYRLMFVLYAESRGLIHPDDPDAESEYQEHFSIEQLRSEIHDTIEGGDSFEDYSEHSTSMWSRLQDLFRLVDEGEDALGIPPYNGGLFDAERHAFLAEHQVADRYIAEVIYRLGTTEADDGSFVLADYADLDTRHLGTIYEGLLEHEFRIAGEEYAAVADDGGQVWKPATDVSVADAVETVEPGELYVVNDDGERKATGAYYTPDYVVTYIVEETVGPLLDDIDEELRAEGLEPSDGAYFGKFWSAVLDLKILDPAMGSGHFLTRATGYLTERVMSVVREHEIQGRDEQDLRRRIARECIYGVDLNGMAVELAKLSMWLETLATDQPLAFLDHHLKTGNSLVGSDVTEVLSEDEADDGGQLTLFEAHARVRQRTLEHVMDLMEELLAIDNETYADVKSMEDLYERIREDPLYQRLFELASVHTAEQFGVDVPDGSYERMADAIEDEAGWAEIRSETWFTTAQSVSEDESFFHWELEFPEVFFGEGGTKREDAGFDAVVGNPPYVSNWNLTEESPELVNVVNKLYPEVAVGHWDLFVPFSYRAITLLKERGRHSYVTSNSIGSEKYGRKIREEIIERTNLEKLVRFSSNNVFTGVNRMVLIYVLERSRNEQSEVDIVKSASEKFSTEGRLKQSHFSEFEDYAWRVDISESDFKLREKVESISVQLGSLCWVNPGVVAHSAEDSPLDFKKDDVLTDNPSESAKKYVSGQDVKRHHVNWSGKYIEYDQYAEHFHRPKSPVLFESEKIMFSDVSGKNNRIKSAFDDSGYFSNHTVNHATKWTDDTEAFKSSFDYDKHESAGSFNLRFVSGVVGSSLLAYYFSNFLATKTLQSSRTRMHPNDIRKLPVIDITKDDGRDGEKSEHAAEISRLTKSITQSHGEKRKLNTNLLDHLGNYSDGHTLAEIGLTQPPENAAESILQQTTEQHPNLRIGEATVERSSENTVEIRLTARYKPDDDSLETDRWGYTETAPLPALRITDLSETEADLVEAFVPVAVDEAGGFAGFRETATKTNSLVDRLQKLTLPAVADVAQGLQNYTETVERAEELEAKIERTDALIDDIVYELYGLTDEEIEIVEESVGE